MMGQGIVMSKEGKTIHTEKEKQMFGKHVQGGLSRGNRTEWTPISKPWWVSLTTSSIFFADISGIALLLEQALYLNSLGNSEGGEKKDLSSQLFLKNNQTKFVLISLDLPPKCRTIFIRKQFIGILRIKIWKTQILV